MNGRIGLWASVGGDINHTGFWEDEGPDVRMEDSMSYVAPPREHARLESPTASSSLPVSPAWQPLRGDTATSAVSDVEARVLGALSDAGHCLTLGQLRARTGITREELKPVLDGLRSKGLAAKLNTVVESYSCRFPGVRVDDV
jgi:hypothetical protein